MPGFFLKTLKLSIDPFTLKAGVVVPKENGYVL